MKEMLVRNFHWFIIAYTFVGLWDIYELKTEALENSAQLPPAVATKIQRAKNQIKKIERFKKNLSKSKERVQEVVKQIEKVQKQLPSDVNDTEVQSLIGDIAKKLKMVEPSPSPGQEVNNGFYFSKEYTFQAKGTFLQAIIFFENLKDSERILNVKSFDIALDESKAKSRFPILNISTAVESFRYNNSYKEKSGVDEIENQFKIK
jgi:Tfp pilus assembly protein PilO